MHHHVMSSNVSCVQDVQALYHVSCSSIASRLASWILIMPCIMDHVQALYSCHVQALHHALYHVSCSSTTSYAMFKHCIMDHDQALHHALYHASCSSNLSMPSQAALPNTFHHIIAHHHYSSQPWTWRHVPEHLHDHRHDRMGRHASLPKHSGIITIYPHQHGQKASPICACSTGISVRGNMNPSYSGTVGESSAPIHQHRTCVVLCWRSGHCMGVESMLIIDAPIMVAGDDHEIPSPSLTITITHPYHPPLADSSTLVVVAHKGPRSHFRHQLSYHPLPSEL